MSDNSERILASRYYKKDDKGNPIENKEEFYTRIAKHIASAEKGKDDKRKYGNKFYDAMYNGYFLPNTPCLANAGIPGGQLAACFVLPMEDSLEDIFNSLALSAKIFQTGGGTGASFDALRPEGCSVGQRGVSSGPVSYIRLFNEMANTIKQGGIRRGAFLAALIVHHPSIRSFITMKYHSMEFANKLRSKGFSQEEVQEVLDAIGFTNCNMSVGITDTFMHAVENKSSYSLKHARTYRENEDANEIWDLIAENAYSSGCPGLLFLDRINKDNPLLPTGRRITASNPCLPGWSPLITKNGCVKLKDAIIGTEIWDGKGWTKIINKQSSGIKKVYKYNTNSGIFYGTSNHKIFQNGKKVKLKDAKTIDTLVGCIPEITKLNTQDILDGLVIGDGCYYSDKSKKVNLCVGENDFDYFNSEIKHLIGKKYDCEKYLVDTSITKEELNYTYNRVIPDRFVYATPNRIRGFLRGLFSANGCVLLTTRVVLKSSSRRLVEQVQCMLSSISINSYITTNKAKSVKFKRGDYKCKASYDINIGHDLEKFSFLIGFIQKAKTDKLNSSLKNHNKGFKKSSFEIKEATLVSEEEVYDITVDNDSHSFWCWGFHTANCGETPMFPNETCNLGHINLAKLMNLKNKTLCGDFCKEFNFELFDKYIELGARFLDNVITVNNYPNKEIKEATLYGRRLGLGIMGYADTLIKKNLVYGSPDALSFTKIIASHFKIKSLNTSIELGKERGVPRAVLDGNIDKSLHRRNLTINTIAPTGSTSMIAEDSPGIKGCTPGIEPIYDPYYEKNVTIGHFEYEQPAKEYFEARGWDWEFYKKERDFRSDTKSITQGGVDWFNELFARGDEIHYKRHIETQAVWQTSIDGGISKTIILPADATPQTFKEAYYLAWRSGCKGITAFKTSEVKTGVYASGEVKKLVKTNKHRLEGFRERVKTSQGTMYVQVNSTPDISPYEVFVTIGKQGYESNAKLEAISRLISLCLRSGIKLERIIRQLMGISCNKLMHSSQGLIRSVPDGIAQVLNSLLSEEEEVENTLDPEEVCPTCFTPLIRKPGGGCPVCPKCGVICSL